jgi:hypothetical protein
VVTLVPGYRLRDTLVAREFAAPPAVVLSVQGLKPRVQGVVVRV